MEVWTYSPGSAQWDRGPDFPVIHPLIAAWLTCTACLQHDLNRLALAFLPPHPSCTALSLRLFGGPQTGQAWGGCASYQGRLIAISGSHSVYPSVGVFDPRVWCLKE